MYILKTQLFKHMKICSLTYLQKIFQRMCRNISVTQSTYLKFRQRCLEHTICLIWKSFNREDYWQTPTEKYFDQDIEMDPYYITMKLPDSDKEEFILMHPYTPKNRQ